MTRGVTRSSVTLPLPSGRRTVPVVVAWADCGCGEVLVGIAETQDSAADALARAERADGWTAAGCHIVVWRGGAADVKRWDLATVAAPAAARAAAAFVRSP